MIAIVRYQIATYSGNVDVVFEDEDIDDEQLIGMAKMNLRRIAGTFPFGAQSFKVISRCGSHE